ncbi:MAG: hypothetical protein GY711_00485 [bacterium]|nr:hypothetical protein [bacterium]
MKNRMSSSGASLIARWMAWAAGVLALSTTGLAQDPCNVVPGDCCAGQPAFDDPGYTFAGQVAVGTASPQAIGTAVLVVYDFSDFSSATPGANFPINRYSDPSWTQLTLGSIFGVTLDADGNIYVTATTCYHSDQVGSGGVGAVYRIDASTGAASVFASLPNTGPELGNIAYDCANEQFFVTNHEDGKIYRLDTAGTILSTFDHGVPDDGSAGFAPLGERLWGVAVHDGRVWFGVWNEDSGTPNPVVTNEIWSVALSGGDFSGTSQLEVSVQAPSGDDYTNPISDIRFTPTGSMLIAEHGQLDDTTPVPHDAQVREYECVGGAWSETASTFSIGIVNGGTNSSGGVDFDYGPGGRVWASADAISLSSPAIYGFQGLPATGGFVSSSILVDYNGNLSVQDKTLIGDIAISCPAGTEVCCLDFNDQTTQGFIPCPQAPNVTLTTPSPGPSGDPQDFFLLLDDQSGPSAACGPAPCAGDWCTLGPCAALCFDERVLDDGVPGSSIPITPAIVITDGTIRAAFFASFTVTDDGGSNPGWHSICAPIRPLGLSGAPPHSSGGAWQMLDGRPDSDWDVLLCNVTEIQLSGDPVGSQTELFGFDNICLRDDVCNFSGVNKDLRNDTGQDVNGVDILLEGTWTLADLRFHFDGGFTSFQMIPVGPNTILRWTGGFTVPPAGVTHVGYAMWSPATTVMGVFWTVNGIAVGCAPQCNIEGRSHPGSGEVRYTNNADSCSSDPLYTGDLVVEYYIVPPPLADWNATTPRVPIQLDVVPFAVCLQPGDEAVLFTPAPPSDAHFALYVFEVGSDPALGGPNTTVDFLLVPLIDAGSPIGTAYCSPNELNSTGQPGSLLAHGSTVVADQNVALFASSLPSNQFGYFLSSPTQGFIAHPGGSIGNFCLGVGDFLGRYNGMVQNTGPVGQAALVLDLTAVPIAIAPGSIAIQAGDTWNWQMWYRDIGNTNNFTDAVSITFQ